MANSDNVIRAGLTPKLRDVPNLVSTLTYVASPPSTQVVHTTPFQGSSKSTLYDPPIPEFSVAQVKVGKGEDEKHDAVGGPSLTIVTEGKGNVTWGEEGKLVVGTGDVFFVGAGTSVKYVNESEGEFVLYRAFVEA
jgi:mannose-6-phosphate isomerase